MKLNKRNVLHRVREPFWDEQTLTDPEAEAVVLAARGYTSKEIGEALGISEEAVTQRLRLACARLGVTSKAGIVRLAWERVIQSIEVMETDGTNY